MTWRRQRRRLRRWYCSGDDDDDGDGDDGVVSDGNGDDDDDDEGDDGDGGDGDSDHEGKGDGVDGGGDDGDDDGNDADNHLRLPFVPTSALPGRCSNHDIDNIYGFSYEDSATLVTLATSTASSQRVHVTHSHGTTVDGVGSDDNVNIITTSASIF